jgi:catechol 2,3-dioxygenase-like lactoylglutathione lyase family enzyme
MSARELEVDLDELVAAMEDHTGEIHHFLDTHTGDVHGMMGDVLSEAEDAEDEPDGAETLPQWQRDDLELARKIVANDGDRFVPVPQNDSGESFRVMEDFIPTVRDRRLREKLSIAIGGKGAFRRFKDVLLDHPDARNEWFAYEAGVKEQWAREWLESIGIHTTWQSPRARQEQQAQSRPPLILGLHHAQITVPRGQEERARQFYCGVLGLQEEPKPASLKGRGGLWLRVGDDLQVHVGTEDGVNRDATKAHLAYEVDDVARWRQHLERHEVKVIDSAPIPGLERFEFRDPFGNRVEMTRRID